MQEPKIKKRVFTVDKRWGRYVLRVNVWDDLMHRWDGWRDAQDSDLPLFFQQMKNPLP